MLAPIINRVALKQTETGRYFTTPAKTQLISIRNAILKGCSLKNDTGTGARESGGRSVQLKLLNYKFMFPPVFNKFFPTFHADGQR